MSAVGRRPSLPEQQYVNNFAKWQDDKDTTQCTSCHQNFTFFQRRHHCRCCGNIFCQDCTSHFVRYDKSKVQVVKRPDYYYYEDAATAGEFAPYRTCDSCYNNLSHLGLLVSAGGTNGNDPNMLRPTVETSLDQSTGSGFPINMEEATSTNTQQQPGVSGNIRENEEEREDDDDRNHCPICNISLKKVSPEQDENVIEQHIESCIRRAERIQQHHTVDPSESSINSPQSHQTTTSTINNTDDTSACPTARNRMLVYKIPYPNNDKTSVINEDDYEECPVCFEQMLPGEKVGRLECLCVFHYRCIKNWFVKKSQQVAAVDGINSVGKNFCPLHDAVF